MADKKDNAGAKADTATSYHRYEAPNKQEQWQQVIGCLGEVKNITSFCDVLWDNASRSNLKNDTWIYTRNRDTHYKQVEVKEVCHNAAVISVKRWPFRKAPHLQQLEAVCDLSTLRFHFEGDTVIDATWMPDHTVYTVMRLSEEGRSGDGNDECLPELPDGCSGVTDKAHARVKEYLLSAGLENKGLKGMWQGERPLYHTHTETPGLPEALATVLKKYTDEHPNSSAARLAMSRWGALSAFGLDAKAKAARSNAKLGDQLDKLESEASATAPDVWRRFQAFAMQLRELPAPDVLALGEEDEEDGGGHFIEIRWLLDGVHVYCDKNGPLMGVHRVGALSLGKDVRKFFEQQH